MNLCAIALTLVLSVQEEKLSLRWKFAKGQELVYRSMQKTLVDFGGAPLEQEMSNTYSMTVTDVDDQGATVLMKVLGVSTKAAGPTGEFAYDSDKDKHPPAEGPGAAIARLVGQSFTMKMSPTGKILEVKGFDKVLETMMKGSDPDDPAAMQMKQMFSNDSFKAEMQQLAPQLPEGKVGKGDTWASDFTIKMPFLGGMKVGIKSTLKDLKDGQALIGQDAKMELQGGDDPNNPFAGAIELKESQGKADLVFSIDRGVLLSQKYAQKMVLSFNGQEIPIKKDSELKLVEGGKKF